MAVYQVYDYEGHVGFFTRFSDAKRAHDNFASEHRSTEIVLFKLNEKSGKFEEEDYWEDGEETCLREITEKEIDKLPDGIFSFKGCEWTSGSAFISEESMLRYLAMRYGDDLNHIKPTKENFAIYTLSQFRNSCTFDHAVESAINLEEE